MAEYLFEAYTREGLKVKGIEAAESGEDVEALLASRGLLVRSIAQKKAVFRLSLTQRQIRRSDLLILVGELLSLLESGMGVPESLSILADDPSNRALGEKIQQVLQQVKSGLAFSAACEQHPNSFEPFFISALKTGEQSGDLTQPLKAYYMHLERTLELRRKLSQALTYPIFLLLTFSIILVMMFVFVVPNFTSMYADIGTALPPLTAWLLATVDNLPLLGIVAASITLLGLLLLRHLNSDSTGRRLLSRVKQGLPITGGLYRLFTYWQFTQSLASMLRGGGNLLFAVRTAQEISENKLFAHQLQKVIERIRNGESLSASLRAETDYPAKSIKMISVGEEASNLQIMLDSIANYYTRQLDDRIKRITSLIEPAIMLFIGLVVGVVIVALYLPVFGMVNVIG